MTTTEHDLPPSAERTLREFWAWIDSTDRIVAVDDYGLGTTDLLYIYFDKIAPDTPVDVQRKVYEMI